MLTDGAKTYTYSTRNQQKTFANGDAAANYTYYYDGLRKSKTVGTDTTYFIWHNGNMVYEFTPTDSNSYTYGLRLISSDDAKFVLNAHGDVVVLIDSTGTIIKRYDYDAFGNELNIDSTDTNPFRYCAEYFDKDTGSIYLRARYYQPVTGRFTQIDPIKDGLNWYAYCANNPIMFVDQNGLYYIVDNGNGLYRLVPANTFTSIASAVFPAWISSSVEAKLGIVGGTSATTTNDVINGVAVDIASKSANVIAKKFGGYVKNLGKYANYISYAITIIDAGIKLDQMLVEDVSFDLLYRNGCPRLSTSASHLTDLMNKTGEFVSENYDYYGSNISGVKMSLYEIDKSLRYSDQPNDLIDKYVKKYSASLYGRIRSSSPVGNIEGLTSNFKFIIKNYDERLSYYDSLYKDKVKS